MIIVMKEEATNDQLNKLTFELREKNMEVQVNDGVTCKVLGVIGDTHILDRDKISMNSGVEKVMAVQEPFKKSNRKFHPEDTVVSVSLPKSAANNMVLGDGGVNIGEGNFTVIAGPCSVESREQIIEVAECVKRSGAALLRGGGFKPRTSPYAFQGLEKEGIMLLDKARSVTGMPIISEIMSLKHIEIFDMMVDVIQIGARNMQNFDLLKEVGKTRRPILLKRGLSATIEEWLMAAEYIMSQGNENVILCERGIRTFETYTRNTLDISAIPAVKRLSHLPIIVDPSHAAGKSWMVQPLALAAMAAGADGLMIEVHNDPANALCDGPQSLTPSEFDELMALIRTDLKARGIKEITSAGAV